MTTRRGLLRNVAVGIVLPSDLDHARVQIADGQHTDLRGPGFAGSPQVTSMWSMWTSSRRTSANGRGRRRRGSARNVSNGSTAFA
jgi:hypothetical protein